MGSLLFKDNVPERDAAVVERVKGAGAIILGKTNAPEQGMVGTCENRLGEPGKNPWDTDRTPGRLKRRGGGGGCGVPVPDRDGQRRRRFDTHTVQLLRRVRHKADSGPSLRLHGRGRPADALHLLPEWANSADGPGRGNAPAGDGRPRSKGPRVTSGEAAGLRRRGRQGYRRSPRSLEPRLRLRRRSPGRPRGHVEGSPGFRGAWLRCRRDGPRDG